MLPDYPTLKRELDALLMRYCEQQTYRRMGILGSIEKLRQFEGDGHTTVWENGDVDDVPMQSSSAEITITHQELQTMTLASALEKLDAVAEAMASQTSQGIYRRIESLTNRTGMVIDGKGEKLGIEHIIAMLERMHVDFDPAGAPRLPSLHVHPRMAEALADTLSALDNDPSARRRLDTVIETKREEHRAREADRKLVG
jgi:hypothetical protein